MPERIREGGLNWSAKHLDCNLRSSGDRYEMRTQSEYSQPSSVLIFGVDTRKASRFSASRMRWAAAIHRSIAYCNVRGI
jgi:hypothetical protein